MRNFTLIFIIFLTTLLADQLSKWVMIELLALPTRAPIELTSFFRLTMVWNRGMSFGMLNNLGNYAPHFFTLIALGVSGALLWWMRTEKRLWLIAAQGLIIGGALGNVIDRWRFGAVADFLDVHFGAYHWPAFNIADSAIFIGVALLMWDAFRGEESGIKNLESGEPCCEEGRRPDAATQNVGGLGWTAASLPFSRFAQTGSPLKMILNRFLNALTSQKVEKVGFLATYKSPEGERRYLMYRPLPKYDFDEVLPYQLARGSIERGEDTLTAAKREAEEELGVYEKDVKDWRDAGVLIYSPNKKDPYPIHWHIAELTHETPTEPLPIDAAGLKWMSEAEVLTGMESGKIKTSYREIFEALASNGSAE